MLPEPAQQPLLPQVAVAQAGSGEEHPGGAQGRRGPEGQGEGAATSWYFVWYHYLNQCRESGIKGSEYR